MSVIRMTDAEAGKVRWEPSGLVGRTIDGMAKPERTRLQERLANHVRNHFRVLCALLEVERDYEAAFRRMRQMDADAGLLVLEIISDSPHLSVPILEFFSREKIMDREFSDNTATRVRNFLIFLADKRQHGGENDLDTIGDLLRAYIPKDAVRYPNIGNDTIDATQALLRDAGLPPLPLRKVRF